MFLRSIDICRRVHIQQKTQIINIIIIIITDMKTSNLTNSVNSVALNQTTVLRGQVFVQRAIFRFLLATKEYLLNIATLLFSPFCCV